jgi:drug/metabolite transporter (DMT)-like permease
MVSSTLPKVADRSPLLLSALFVLLWSTGFVFAKLGLQYAQPFTFLALRFCIVTCADWRHRDRLARALAADLARDRPFQRHRRADAWPLSRRHLRIDQRRVPAGIAALIVGLQPLLTATVVGPVLGERVRLLQWVGLCLGFIGVTLVLWEKLIIGHVPWLAAAWSVIALFAITAATIYQKRFCPTMDWRTGGFVQYAAVALLVGSLAMLSERGAVRWEAGLVVALGYLVIVLSIGAITLLNWLIRRGRAARIASLSIWCRRWLLSNPGYGSARSSVSPRSSAWG